MENIIVILILAAITAAIVWYLVRTKMKGAKCVSCPYADHCGSACGGGCQGGAAKAPEENEP